jgi:fatty acid elongase 3
MFLQDSILPPIYSILQKNLLPNLPPTPAQFNFEQHASWVADTTIVAYVMAVYFLFVFASFQFRPLFQQISKTIPQTLQMIFIVHNVILSAVSLLLLALIVENLVPRLIQNGLMWGMCHRDAYETDHRLEFYYYINYLLKYYELIDTCMLVLKGKRLEFLHWYHHSMTLFLCFTQLMGRTSISWVPIVLNLCVHVIMYYYYARTAISSKPVWWKKHLTTLQITQFVIDLAAINFVMYIGTVMLYRPFWESLLSIELWHPSWGSLGRGLSSDLDYGAEVKCHGTYPAGVCGWLILSSYLLLFIQFFLKTYNSNSKKKKNNAMTKDGKKQKAAENNLQNSELQNLKEE